MKNNILNCCNFVKKKKKGDFEKFSKIVERFNLLIFVIQIFSHRYKGYFSFHEIEEMNKTFFKNLLR